MPSPLLHAAAGVGICAARHSSTDRLRRSVWVWVVVASVFPDADLLLGLFVDDPNRFHGNYSHSLGSAVMAGCLAALLCRVERIVTGMLVFLGWASHCLLDSMNFDGRPPLGVPILWPFSGQAIQFPWTPFPGIHHGSEGASTSQFWDEVFSVSNLNTVLTEAVIATVYIAGCAMVGAMIRKRRR